MSEPTCEQLALDLALWQKLCPGCKGKGFIAWGDDAGTTTAVFNCSMCKGTCKVYVLDTDGKLGLRKPCAQIHNIMDTGKWPVGQHILEATQSIRGAKTCAEAGCLGFTVNSSDASYTAWLRASAAIWHVNIMATGEGYTSLRDYNTWKRVGRTRAIGVLSLLKAMTQARQAMEAIDADNQ